MDMPSRTFGMQARYGFNGKERDKDLHSLTAYDYGFRIYNPAIGRFLSVDPLTKEYPWYTPYQYAGNKPIKYIDRDGAEEDDPDKRLNSVVPKIKQTFDENIKKLPADEQGKYITAVNQAFRIRGWFNNPISDRWLSTRFITRWMEGQGGYDIISYKALRNRLSGVATMQFMINRNQIIKEIENKTLIYAKTITKEGGYDFTTSTHRDVGQAASGLYDFGTAIGSYKLMGKGVSFISKDKDGELTITTTIYYTLADKYQWKPGHGINFEEFANADLMLKLEKIGAKPFYIRCYFEKTYRYANGRYEHGGDYKDSVSDWYFVDDGSGNIKRGELSNPEPRSGNGYAIPTDENTKKHDHRGE